MTWRPISEWKGFDPPGVAYVFCERGDSPVYGWQRRDDTTHFAVLTPPSVSAGPSDDLARTVANLLERVGRLEQVK